MQLTEEQHAIINSKGDIRINAVAGSGKTTTVIEYARTRPEGSKILYLAFNKSVKLEAEHKFRQKGLNNVRIETAHSLAYKHIIFQHKYKVKSNSYKSHELIDLLNLRGYEGKHTGHILANHVMKFCAFYCNSDKAKPDDLNYIDTQTDNKARSFVSSYYGEILLKTTEFLKLMDQGKIEITHDFYLKKYQMSHPVLKYDYILFDEGQDASAAMLDVFLKQKAIRVIVGDTHQQIYGWRYAVNSLEKAHFTTYHLSTSFRFGNDIAGLAMATLQLKERIDKKINFTISGAGNTTAIQSRAIVARTNLGLLKQAIDYIEKNKVNKIYFEGNIYSYTYADDGTSLYDVLNLSSGKRRMIKDKLIAGMRNMEELDEYINSTGDLQLGMMSEIVKDYGERIPQILENLKKLHVDNSEKEKAEIIFSTVHRCKGMEYDEVELANDFITEESIKKALEKDDKGNLIDKLNEEINLLYVAITRTKNKLNIPEQFVPKDFPKSENIHLLAAPPDEMEEEINSYRKKLHGEISTQPNTFDSNGRKQQEAHKLWTEEMDDELTQMYYEGFYIKTIAQHFGRSNAAILSRIRKLDLEEMGTEE
jgi:F-box protein, helicase, 18